MSLKIFLLRHGETECSQSGTYCGIINPDLTPEGMQMAQFFANAYQNIPWTDVYVSPMKRAIDTAKPLCDILGLPMQVREGLKEIAYGDWENKDSDYVKEHYQQDYIRWLTEPAWNSPTDGETSTQVASRALPVLTEIENKYHDGNVLIVSHKATIRIILCSLLGIDIGRYRDRLDVPAASLSVVKFDLHGPMLLQLGDRSFLPEYLLTRAGT